MSSFHPAIFIQDEMSARNWTVADMVESMGVDDPHKWVLAWDLYLTTKNHDVRFDVDSPEHLSKAFGTSAALWRNLEAAYLEAEDE